MPRRILFLGGNGHCGARLARARESARLKATGTALELNDVPYPGFEGRPRVACLDAFLDALEPHAAAPSDLVYATGVGGLVALALRARGALGAVPLVLQAPVLWGLERRLMPRLMRAPLAPRLVHGLFGVAAFQSFFVRRFFLRAPSPEDRAAFFQGYAACAALPDLFAWLTPAFLRVLADRLAARPGATEGIAVWWGGCDRVVSIEELAWTEPVLEVRWPCRVFPEWGHYPMIESPEAWVAALAVPKLESVLLDAGGDAVAPLGSSR